MDSTESCEEDMDYMEPGTKTKNTKKLFWWEIENDQFSEFFTEWYGSLNRCRLCPFMTSHSALFGKHIKEVHSECERYQCKFCFKEFPDELKCMGHIENSHNDELKLEKKNCKDVRNRRSGNNYLHRYSYNVVPSKAYFKSAKANMLIGHQNESAVGEEFEEEESHLLIGSKSELPRRETADQRKLVSEVPTVVDLTHVENDVPDQKIGNISNEIHDNKNEISDEHGNLLIVTSKESADQFDFENVAMFQNTQSGYNVKNEVSNLNISTQSQSSSSSADSLHTIQKSSIKQPPKEPGLKIIRKNNIPAEETNKYLKPKFLYSQLIYLALKNSTNGKLLVCEIYLFIKEHFPYYKYTVSSWKNCIRHTLCGRNCFVKIPKPGVLADSAKQQKHSCWMFSLDQEVITKMETEIDNIISQHFSSLCCAMSNPENLAMLQQGLLTTKSCRSKSSLVNMKQYEIVDLTCPDVPDTVNIQEQLKDTSDIVPCTSLPYSLENSAVSTVMDESSSYYHYNLVDNGSTFELQPVEDTSVFYVYDKR